MKKKKRIPLPILDHKTLCNTHAEDTLYSCTLCGGDQRSIKRACARLVGIDKQTQIGLKCFCSKLCSGDFDFTRAHLHVIWQLLENLHYMLLLHGRIFINVFFEFLWTVLKNCHNSLIMEMYSIKQIDAFWVKMLTDLRLFVCVRKVRLLNPLQLLLDRLA